jgi:hypothetical protein
VRHLTEFQLIATLRRGATVEQEVPASPATFAWLSATPGKDGIELTYHHVHDDGSERWFDVYEFRPVSDDEEDEWGRVIGVFADAETLQDAAGHLGARRDRWVNEGMIQHEYGDHRWGGLDRVRER